MKRYGTLTGFAAALLVASSLATLAIAQDAQAPATTQTPAASQAPAAAATGGQAASSDALLDWVAKGDDWPQRKAELQALGEQFETSEALFEHFQQAANGGANPTWEDMAKPEFNWSGVWTRSGGGLSYDPDIKASEGATTAQLTPEGQARVDEKRKMMEETGGEYDPISDCRAPGTPRWHTEPFLHEYVVTPEQTWLMNEMVNDVRRVYTDGREHTAEEDAYPSWNGDTIGFWDGDMLVTHTKYLKSGQYQRGIQPDYSDQVTLVERWRKVDDKTLQADVWVYDPVNLAEPWYTRQSWTQLTNDEHMLRLRYWDCGENENNDIVIRDDGTSQFPDFDFVQNDAEVSNDPAVAKAQAARAAAEQAAADKAAAGNANPSQGGNAQ